MFVLKPRHRHRAQAQYERYIEIGNHNLVPTVTTAHSHGNKISGPERVPSESYHVLIVARYATYTKPIFTLESKINRTHLISTPADSPAVRDPLQ